MKKNLETQIRRAQLAAFYRLPQAVVDTLEWEEQFRPAPDFDEILREAENALAGKGFEKDFAHYIYWSIKNAIQTSFDITSRGHSRFGCWLGHTYASLVIAGKTDSESLKRLCALAYVRDAARGIRV